MISGGNVSLFMKVSLTKVVVSETVYQTWPMSYAQVIMMTLSHCHIS